MHVNQESNCTTHNVLQMQNPICVLFWVLHDVTVSVCLACAEIKQTSSKMVDVA